MKEYPFKNLVFEGGGVKGIAYVGALEQLNTLNALENIEKVGGTSAGAITAVLVALKYTTGEIRKILWDLDFKRLMDDDWGVLRDTHRLIHQFGYYKGDYFKDWIEELIEEKTGVIKLTFQTLHDMDFLDLYLIGANLSTGYSEIFSWEHTPDMEVAEAARISMSIPLFFQAVRNQEDHIYVDGGLFNNYPIKLFDYNGIVNDETLGFRLDSESEIAAFRTGTPLEGKPILDIFDYIQALMRGLLNQQDSRHLHSKDWKRTIYIACDGISAVDFDLSDERKKQLLNAGVIGVREFFTEKKDI